MLPRSAVHASAPPAVLPLEPRLGEAPAWSGFDVRRLPDAVLLLLPIAYFAGNVLLHRWNPAWYARHVLREDGLLENTQAFAYALAAFFAARSAKRLFAVDLAGHAWASLGLALVCLLLGLEELNFGQRLLGFAVPDWIRRRNLQGELNLHNLSVWHRLQGEVQLAISAVGALAWWLVPARWLRARAGLLGYVVPGPGTTLYFAQEGLYQIGLYAQLWLPEARPLRAGHQELFETPFAVAFAIHAWSMSRAYERVLNGSDRR